MRCSAGIRPGFAPVEHRRGPFPRGALSPGCHLVCYADDTLMMTEGRDWDAAVMSANIAVQCVWRSIEGLGLKVSSHKTEALFLHNVAWEEGGRGGAESVVSNLAISRFIPSYSTRYIRLSVSVYMILHLCLCIRESRDPRHHGLSVSNGEAWHDKVLRAA